MSKLKARKGVAPRAIEFAILTAARSSEVRAWNGLRLISKTNCGQCGKIASKLRIHKVPLSDDAIGVLKAVPRFEGN